MRPLLALTCQACGVTHVDSALKAQSHHEDKPGCPSCGDGHLNFASAEVVRAERLKEARAHTALLEKIAEALTKR